MDAGRKEQEKRSEESDEQREEERLDRIRVGMGICLIIMAIGITVVIFLGM